MKFHLIRKNLQISSIIIQVLLYTILFSTTHSLRFRLSKTDDLLADAGVSSSKKPEEEISDKELEALLKDPKYAALAGDVFKSPSGGPSSSSSSKLDDSLAGLTDSAVDMKSLETSIKHKSSSLSKGKLDAKSSKDDPLDKMEMLSKSLGASDPMKDLDLLGGSGFDSKPSNDKKKEKKNEEEEKFKKFDFMTKQQARYLIEVLKQPVFYNMLPMEAQQIVNSVNDSFSFKFSQNDKISDYIEASMTNTPTSQTFIDPDGTIARKGILTLIDPETGNSKFVWTISNAKVLCFFQSQSLLTIVKLYRNSSLVVKDVNSTPCFLLTNFKDTKDGSVLACATSTQEKEVWIQTVKSHLQNKS